MKTKKDGGKYGSISRGAGQCLSYFGAAKKASWTAYVSGSNRQGSITTVWGRIKHTTGKFIPLPPPTLRRNGVDVVDPVFVAVEIGRLLAGRCHANTDDPDFAALKLQSELTPVNFSTSIELAYK